MPGVRIERIRSLSFQCIHTPLLPVACTEYGDPAYGLSKRIARVFDAATDKRLTGEFTEFNKDMDGLQQQ